MEKNTYRFNGIEVPELTMADAISIARKRVLEYEKTVVLKVKTQAGDWLMLGTYSPVKKECWEYHEDPDNMKSPLIPIVCAEPIIDRKKSFVRTIKAILTPGVTKGKDTYRLVIGGKPDPLNRVFCASTISGSRTAKDDVCSWFENMKANGLYPQVKELTFI